MSNAWVPVIAAVATAVVAGLAVLLQSYLQRKERPVSPSSSPQVDNPGPLEVYGLADALDDDQSLRFRLIVAASLALGGNDAVSGNDAIAVAEFVLGPKAAPATPTTWGS